MKTNERIYNSHMEDARWGLMMAGKVHEWIQTNDLPFEVSWYDIIKDQTVTFEYNGDAKNSLEAIKDLDALARLLGCKKFSDFTVVLSCALRASVMLTIYGVRKTFLGVEDVPLQIEVPWLRPCCRVEKVQTETHTVVCDI